MADTTVTLRDQGGSPATMKLVDLGDGTWCFADPNSQDSYENITTATTTVVKSAPGRLSRLVFNVMAALSVVTLYDNTAASGDIIGTITSPATLLQNHGVIEYGCLFATGLTVVTSLPVDLTVVYR